MGTLAQGSYKSLKAENQPRGSEATDLPNINLSNCKSLQWATTFSHWLLKGHLSSTNQLMWFCCFKHSIIFSPIVFPQTIFPQTSVPVEPQTLQSSKSYSALPSTFLNIWYLFPGTLLLPFMFLKIILNFIKVICKLV